ncbi:MAG: hypothetical protein COT00_04130 [Candidatus Omnitrophica bacterium CG07_land_8_20_14_0_80_50_8]|nr:MAG: hypothetical protein COT00_04130 [Candidatus Omnitrophica bacterium CG07_land_8_20_14_0_80_50_8]
MNCSLPGLFAKCTCSGGMICLYCLRLTVTVVAMALGAVVVWQPRKIIDMQIAAYRLINWKMEPISMEKEIRNTRIMGLAVLILGVFAFITIWLIQ